MSLKFHIFATKWSLRNFYNFSSLEKKERRLFLGSGLGATTLSRTAVSISTRNDTPLENFTQLYSAKRRRVQMAYGGVTLIRKALKQMTLIRLLFYVIIAVLLSVVLLKISFCPLTFV
jgi:hypothetical protein